MYWVAPAACTISACYMYLGSNPSASTGTVYCKVQILKNSLLEAGSAATNGSIFPSDAALEITNNTTANTGGIYAVSSTSFDTTNHLDDLAAGDVLWFRVNQADAGSADLTIRVKVTYS